MKTITIEEEVTLAKGIINKALKGKRHSNYDQVKEYDELCFQLATGDGLTKRLMRFEITESEKEFNLRERITKTIVSATYNSLADPQYKVPRSNNAVRVLAYDQSNKDNGDEFFKIIQTFNKKDSIDDWMADDWIRLNNQRPNCWITLEWDLFNNLTERAKPYPLIFGADKVLNFCEGQDGLEWALIENSRSVEVNRIEYELKRYTFYGLMITLSFSEIAPEELQPEGWETAEVGSLKYFIEIPSEHKLGWVPAFRPGFVRDPKNNITFLSTLDRIIPILLKLLDRDSQMDITMNLHAFPRKYRYDVQCSVKGCNGGELIDGSKCKKCGGTGFLNRSLTTNVMEETVLPLPNDPTNDQIIDLSRLSHYVTPPVELIKFMESHIEKLKEECRQVLYNSEVFSRKQITETATKQTIDLQNVYDALYPLSVAWSRDWEWLMIGVAKICDLDKGLIASYRFGKDFKMKTLSDLYRDLELISKSGADNFIRSAIQDDIAGIIYGEDKQTMTKYWTLKQFFPFPGKTKEEIIGIVTGTLTTRFNAVLWANYDYIFSEIEYEQAINSVDFYTLARPKQWVLIQEKVNSMIEDMKSQAAILMPFVAKRGDTSGNAATA